MSNPVLIPLLNPNEPEALLAALYVTEGQLIAEGDLLCTLETTKSTADLHAESGGYVIGLRVTEGQPVHAGDIFCYLADSSDWQPPQFENPPSEISDTFNQSESQVPKDLRITQPALELARQHNLELSKLPMGPLITEQMVQNFLEKRPQTNFPVSKSSFDPMAMVIYGCGGHGKACLDMVYSLGTYQVVGFVDDGVPSGEKMMGLPVLGGQEVLAGLYDQGIRLAINAVGGIGNVTIRIKVFNILAKAGFACPTIVHPTAFVETSAVLSPGVQVFPHAYVGSEARVGFGSIINTGAIISHDCVLEEVVNISPGAILAGEVQVESRALVGMGATVNLQARIGAGARIGNGATVKSDVPENGIVRAGSVWPK
jgi:sugar O-acyltransferase (sialic acid O-acetyltransferase NeuD family)